MKIFMFFINSVYWLWIFIVPAGILSFVAYCLYVTNTSNLLVSIIIAAAGIVSGIFFAEKVRKKYDLSNFFGSMGASADIDGESVSGKKAEEEQ
ncbi:hypothetical protein [Ferruginibacter profundus]